MRSITNTKTLLFLFILLLAASLRLFWLDTLPHSINRDELHYLLSAQAFFATGKDSTQTVTPFDILTFHYPSGEPVQAELPYFLQMMPLLFGITGVMGNALPNAVFGILLVPLMYVITRKLVGNPWVALISSCMTAINPWFVLMSRTSYEVIPATFFFLCAFLVLLMAKQWKILLSLPFLLGAFYAYIATKVIFLPILLLFIIYSYFFVNKKRYTKYYAVVFVLAVLLVDVFLLQIKRFPNSSRLAEVLLPTAQMITTHVHEAQKASIVTQWGAVFDNQIVYFSKMLLANTFDIFSPTYLFLQGDAFFSLQQHGLFYASDIVFLIIGCLWFYKTKRQVSLWLLAVITITIVPQIVHDQTGNFSPHVTLLVPFFLVLISVGIWRFLNAFPKKGKVYVGIGLCVLYLFLVGNLITTYFFHVPLSPNFFNFPDRVLSQYIALAQSPQRPISVYTQDPEFRFKEYIFYNNLYSKSTASTIAAMLKKHTYSLGNVTFLPCNRQSKQIPQKGVSIIRRECSASANKQTISLSISQLDGLSKVYILSGDSVCRPYRLSHRSLPITIDAFAVERLSTQQFCTQLLIHEQ